MAYRVRGRKRAYSPLAPYARRTTLSATSSLPRCLPHVAVLVLLAAAARAGVVAADLLAAVADRFGLLVASLATGNRRALLAGHAGLAQCPGGGFVGGGLDRPLLEATLLFHAEDAVGHL